VELNPDASKRIRELTAQMQVEKDPQKFTALVKELNRLLDDDESTAPSAEGKS
jgi:hypothetical protein